MRKILIRAGMSPLERYDIDWVLQNDRIGTNSGNLIYQYSVYRALMTEGTEFISDYFYANTCSQEYIDRINSECECVVLPLANAFRDHFPLRPLADFVRQLKIPCVVIGCGLQADNPAQIANGFKFDDDAKYFVSAVLERSAMLGLRGEMTGQYLKQLGFAPERHFTVTGCPSMYIWGETLPQLRLSELTEDSKISINTRIKQPKPLHLLLSRTIAEYPDCHLLWQKSEELALLKYGAPIFSRTSAAKDGNGYYPRNLRHEMIRSGRTVGFVSAKEWIDFLREKDFSLGSRIHGNIAAVISGTPAYVFTTDTRTEELCRYHNIQFMPAKEVREGMSFREIVEKADFASVNRGHAERFRHFVDFLNANSLEHIYRESLCPTDTPFDRAMQRVSFPEAKCVGGRVSPAQRLKGGYAYRSTARRVKSKVRSVVKKTLGR